MATVEANEKRRNAAEDERLEGEQSPVGARSLHPYGWSSPVGNSSDGLSGLDRCEWSWRISGWPTLGCKLSPASE